MSDVMLLSMVKLLGGLVIMVPAVEHSSLLGGIALAVMWGLAVEAYAWFVRKVYKL